MVFKFNDHTITIFENTEPTMECEGYMSNYPTCSLNEIEGPWWILEAKIERPVGFWGACRLRIRVGGREVHLDRTDADPGGIVHLRHLLKLPIGDCTIRLDWIEEGIPQRPGAGVMGPMDVGGHEEGIIKFRNYS